MKLLFTLAILSVLSIAKVNAQTTQPLNKIPATMDSLTWHLPKTADALKQPIPQFYNRATTELNFGESQLKPGSTALLVYSMMPVVRSRDHFTMPVMHPKTTNDKMNKPVQVVDPQTPIHP